MPRLLLALALLAAGLARAAEPDPTAARLAAAIAELDRDAGDPRGLVPLAALSDLEDDTADLGRVAFAYAKAANDRDAHPEVRALARFLLSRAERARGNLHKAAAELEKLGFLRRWQVIGPFDDEGKRGHEAVYPPEERQDLSQRHPGKVREVAWRELPAEATDDGFVHLGAALRPAREVTAYALATVPSRRDETVRLHLGASGAVKVWVNGALAADDASHHPARPDQLQIPVALRRGENRLLVKVSHQDGRFGFYARLAPAAGGRPALDVLAARVREAEKARAPAERLARLRHDLAVALDLRQAGDARARLAADEARRAAAAAPRDVELQLLSARLEEDGNRRRERLLAALRAAPGDARALLALARHQLGRGDAHEAIRLLHRALGSAPGWVPARLALADAWDAAGMQARARAERLATADAAPHHPSAVLAGARAARALERAEDAAARLRKALALRFDDQAARAGLVQLLVDRGDLDGALALLAEAERLAPAELDDRLRRAEALAAAGRADEAEAAFAAALRICPEEPEILERRGGARLRAGRTKEALADLHAALELKPQNAQLKELVRALEPERERFERPYAQDARALAAAAPAPSPDDDAIVLSDLHVTRVHPSGLSSAYTQLVVKIVTPRGADQFRAHGFGYAPDRQEVRVDRARILKPDGSVVDSYAENDRSASEPWYRLYYDTRSRTISFPSLAPGDVLELAVRRDDVAGENLLSDYFGELVFLGDTTRKARFDYVLLVPERRKIFSAEPQVKGVERSERKLEGGVVEHRWVAKDVARVRPEPGMPGWSDVAPYVHVSTYASWDDVQRFWWGLVRDQVEPTPEVRATALGIARQVLGSRAPQELPLPPLSREEELAVIRAVHAFVVTNTRYVGLEIGIHGYKPYRVDQILDRRFGDCKDKASLTWSMLRALGIESRLVLLRMKRLGRVPEWPASLAVFNHAILHVPKHGLWLDGTASNSGTGDLPGEDRGATVLVVEPGAKPWFGTIPEARPEENRTETRFEVALGADGSARVKGASSIAGVQAPSYRRAYGAERNRRAAFEQAFSRTFPGLEVKDVALSDLSRLDEAVALTFTLELPRFGEPEGQGFRFLPFGNAHSYVESWAPLSTRTQELAVGEPYENRFAFRYALPAGWDATQVPPATKGDGPAAAFEVSYRREPGALVAEGRVVLKQGRVRPADYHAFRALAASLDRALARPVHLAPVAASGAASGAAAATGAPAR